jgi:nucleoside-diphosphate-sugar epimerase
MKDSECEGVITLAAIRNPSDYLVASHNTNVVISWNVLRAAAEVFPASISQTSSI